jgi:hypothetical protein
MVVGDDVSMDKIPELIGKTRGVILWKGGMSKGFRELYR